MSKIERYAWKISDVVRETGLPYDFIYDALRDGSLGGIVRPHFLRTNAACVADWEESMKVKPATVAPIEKKQTRVKGKAQAFTHVDPATFGTKSG